MLLLAGLTLLCLSLTAALVLATSEQPVAYGPTQTAGGGVEPSTALLAAAPETGGGSAASGAAEGRETPEAETVALDSLLAAFPAEPRPIPVATIARVENASEEALEVELGHLLDAVQTGFGDRSAQLEPTLRPYLFRIAGRLSVRTEAFRVAVTAPDASLARARAATLRRLFDVAGISDSRLSIGAGEGPHSLSLVTD